MRVLLIANTLPPVDLSGAGEQVLQLKAGLEAKGCEVRVLGRGRGGARGPKVLFPLTVLLPALRWVGRWQPHVVQVHESDSGLAVPFLVQLRKWSGRPFRLVALLQVSYREERRAVRDLLDRSQSPPTVLARPSAAERRFRRYRTPVQIVLGRWTARRADLVLAPSRVTAAELERDYGVRGVEVLPNASGAVAEPDDGDPENGGLRPLLFVGRLRIRKGVEVLLEAMARLAAEGNDWPLLVVGDGERRLLLEGRARALGLEQVKFVGRASAQRTRSLLRQALALVVPSTYEGMPLVVLEAMQQRTAVVASAVSGIPEVVIDGETGWLVPPEDPMRLAQVLAQVIRSSSEAERRGGLGRQRLDALYRPRTVAELWLQRLRSVEE